MLHFCVSLLRPLWLGSEVHLFSFWFKTGLLINCGHIGAVCPCKWTIHCNGPNELMLKINIASVRFTCSQLLLTVDSSPSGRRNGMIASKRFCSNFRPSPLETGKARWRPLQQRHLFGAETQTVDGEAQTSS